MIEINKIETLKINVTLKKYVLNITKYNNNITIVKYDMLNYNRMQNFLKRSKKQQNIFCK